MEAYSGSIGRRHKEQEEPNLENPFLEDFSRIIVSDAYDRLHENSRVLQPVSSKYPFSVGSRRLHSRNVRYLTSAIAEQLGLNKELCISVSEAHDLGHPLYCHIGETALSDISGKPLNHPNYGVVVAQHIANSGTGLNLTYETLMGILLHSNGFENLKPEDPLEYFVVAAADTIDWVCCDIDEVVVSGYLRKKDLPEYINQLGSNAEERKGRVVQELIRNSLESRTIQFEDNGITDIFLKAKEFLVQKVYHKMDYSKHRDVVFRIYDFFAESLPELDPVILTSLVTDREANMFARIIGGTKKDKMDLIKRFRAYPMIPHLEGKDIDFTDPDLDWGK